MRDVHLPLDSSPRERPAVSVIVPSHFADKPLDEFLPSRPAQGFTSLEVVVLDRHATDERQLSAGDTPIRIVPDRSLSVPASYNAAIATARGRYVCVLENGDVPQPTCFERLTQVLDDRPSVASTTCRLQMRSETARCFIDAHTEFPLLLLPSTAVAPMLVRRDALLAVGGYDENMPERGYEPWELRVHLVARGFAGVLVPDALAATRMGVPDGFNADGGFPLAVVKYTLEKHCDAYNQHAFALLSSWEQVSCDLQRTNYELEYEIDGRIRPDIDEARRQLDLGRAQTAPPTSREVRVSESASGRDDVMKALHASQREVDALRASLSWRITYPLRAGLDLCRWVVRHRGPGQSAGLSKTGGA